MFKKDLDLQRKWSFLTKTLGENLGKRPKDLNSVLFLIGVQELGAGPKNYSKEEKQDLMHLAICKVLSLSGFYELEGHDQDGWPHWNLVKKLPRISLGEQEKMLKMHVIEYFELEYDMKTPDAYYPPEAENGSKNPWEE
ncbi:MAG: hypothetical protein LAT68_03230 [Cyclobacteriaceae bacterium]|nr:hypothetical protein [Cyclobacteriaceae bacterium]